MLNNARQMDVAGVQPMSLELHGASLNQVHVSIATLTTEIYYVLAPVGVLTRKLEQKHSWAIPEKTPSHLQTYSTKN